MQVDNTEDSSRSTRAGAADTHNSSSLQRSRLTLHAPSGSQGQRAGASGAALAGLHCLDHDLLWHLRGPPERHGGDTCCQPWAEQSQPSKHLPVNPSHHLPTPSERVLASPPPTAFLDRRKQNSTASATSWGEMAPWPPNLSLFSAMPVCCSSAGSSSAGAGGRQAVFNGQVSAHPQQAAASSQRSQRSC